MKIRKIVTGCIVLAVSGSAAAQGVFNFDEIPGIDQEPAVVVDLNSVMIGFVREVMRAADPDGAALLDGLRSMNLRVYEGSNNSRQFSRFIDNVTDELEGNGWLPVITAQDEGSKVRIHMRMTDQEVSGMTVMVVDGSEAIFINIDGSVSAQDLGRVMALLPVDDALGSIGLPNLTRQREAVPPSQVDSPSP